MKAKKRITGLSISTKNILIILGVVFFSIATTIFIQGINDIATLRNHLITKIEGVAKLLSDNSDVALQFEDKNLGNRLLISLGVIPEVSGALLTYLDGSEFLSHKIDPAVSFNILRELTTPTQFIGDFLCIAQQIHEQGEPFGTAYVIASTENLYRQIRNYVIFSLGILFTVFLTAAAIGTWLSRTLTGPILVLARTATVISDNRDFSLRVKRVSNDEIGTLYDSFNEMLDQIVSKNDEILELNENLEEKVRIRTQDLQRATDQAENARRAAELADRAKSTFLANMSHEIRTPMNAILGYSRLLSKIVTDPKQLEYLEIVQASGRNLLSLINDILDLSKIESGKLSLVYRPMNPHQIFNEIKGIFKIKTEEKNIDFIINIDPTIPTGLLMDETRLRQILFNVVGNAVKFTEKGFVKLSVIRRHSEHQTSRISLIFNIEDSGIGIPFEQIDDIFKAFEQQKDLGGKYGGTGLGLAITKRLVEIMNGRIVVSSQVDVGSTFSIELNDIEISSFLVDTTPKDLPAIETLQFKGSTVLLVEDNLYNLKLVQALLEDKNIVVQQAFNGRDALEKLEESIPELILMDMKMYGMDGYEATRIIKADPKLKDIPVIALTADAMKEGKQKVKEAGCNGFLTKPINEKHLYAELMKYLPHDIEKESTQAKAHTPPLPTSINLDHLTPLETDEIIEIFSHQLLDQWRQMGDSLLLDEWIHFGSNIKSAGEKFNSEFIIDYGQHIIENVEHLNIAVLRKTIKNFPAIVEIIKGVKNESTTRTRPERTISTDSTGG